MFSNSPKIKIPTIKKIKRFDDLWNPGLLDLKDYGPRLNKSFRFILVKIDSLSKYAWTFSLGNKSGQVIKD